MNVSLNNVAAGISSNSDAIRRAFDRVLRSGTYILGPEVNAFESEFSAYLGIDHCVAVASGTSGIQIALESLGLGEAALVGVPSHTAVASVFGILAAGCVPVLLDVDRTSFVLDAECCETAIKKLARNSRRLAAILTVHLYGLPCNMREISDVAKRHGVKIVEDCAQACGASIDGQRVGTFGDAGVFSFYPTKNLSAIGDGGAIVMRSPDLCERAYRLRQYGWPREGNRVSDTHGYNSRMDSLQAAILRARLPRLDTENDARRSAASVYSNKLDTDLVTVPPLRPGTAHVFHQYVITTANRDALRSDLMSRGIEAAIHYEFPAHHHSGIFKKAIIPRRLNNTEFISKHILSLPIYPQIPSTDIEYVISSINAFAEMTRCKS